MTRTVGDLLGELLADAGVTRTWGERLEGLALDHVEITGDPDLAALLADADGRIGTGFGAALVGGRIVHLSSKPGGTTMPVTVRSADELLDAFAAMPDDGLPQTFAVHLDVDLAEPTDRIAQQRVGREVVVTLNPSFADASVVVIAGPGVARGGKDAGLRELGARTGWQVFNSWGAKGVYAWFDDHHGGTIGLQRRDLELARVQDAELVIATGLDPDELGIDDLGSAVVQVVDPHQLAALTYRWPVTAREPAPRSDFYGVISGVVTPMYEATTTPIAPARAALHLSGARPEAGVVVADAGVAGFWLARTFPTREPGSLVVPATHQEGFAVAAAVAAAVGGRPCVAVVDADPDGQPDETSRMVIDAAASLGVVPAVQVWGANGDPVDVDEHARRSEEQFGGHTGLMAVRLRDGDLDALVEVAGEVVAWGGTGFGRPGGQDG